MSPSSVPSAMISRLLHQSRSVEDPWNSPDVPLYDTTTFCFESTQHVLDVVEGRKSGALYTRYGHNPTLRALERSLALLEHAESALAFGSGMAALSALFMAYGQNGIVVLGETYGGTRELLLQQLSSIGFKVYMKHYPVKDDIYKFIQAGTLVFFESPSNPTLNVRNLRTTAEYCHRMGALVAIDSTFATPINQNPLDAGIDFVVHSATKYLGGHSDITAGCIMGREELLRPIDAWRKNLGSVLAPSVAHLLHRSLKTLELRVKAQNHSALFLAEQLETHPKVLAVHYPGLASSTGYAVAKEQMRGFGGMLSFDVRGGFEAARTVADHVRLFVLAPSLGGVESLLTQPCTTSHHGMTAEERHFMGVGDGMLRLSVGLESPEELWADLLAALDQVA